MNSDHLYQKYPRLPQLLEQLCEQQLDQAGADELSLLVEADPQVADWYVRYLELHTHLYWDLAIPAEREEACSSFRNPAENAKIRQLAQGLFADLDLLEAEDLLRESSPKYASAPQKWSSRVLQRAAAVVGSVLVLLLMVWWGISSLPEQAGSIAHHEKDLDADVAGVESNSPGIIAAESKAESPVVAEPLVLPQLDWPSLTGSPRKPLAGAWPAESTPPVMVATENQSETKPAVLSDAEIVAAINRHVESGWQDFTVSPSPEATAYEWVRRVYLDLAGRIPSPVEVKSFVEDKDPRREEKLVDLLLASPDFDLQWASRWTNLLVGRSPNEQVDRMSLLSYLQDSISDNQGWNHVVADLIAAEGDPKESGAANFLVAHLNNQAVPATAFVARNLLGSQIHCAQCHRHPYYEASQQDFWELNSFFKQAVVKQENVPAGMMNSGEKQNRKVRYRLVDEPVGGATYYETLGGVMQVAYPRFNGQAVDAEKTTSRRKELAKIIASGNDSQIAYAFVNRSWSHYFGYGFTNPVDDLGPHNSPTHPELFQLLAESFVAHDYDVKRLAKWICLSRPYRLSSQVVAGNQQDRPEFGELPAFSRMYFKPLTAEQLYDSLMVIKGDQALLRQDLQAQLKQREHWTGQFASSLQNDENGEENHFEGTISQALAMMNGALVSETISPEQNPAMEQLVRASLSDMEKFEQLCLAVVARKPRPEEVTLFRKISHSLRNTKNSSEREILLSNRLEDVLWAYLNSSEFITNH